jgi:phosphopantothenoylcysteine decarboxylase/phosphopantothenate--cysteine ligase
MKRIVLGVSGSVAAYKIPELIRILSSKGYEIKVTMTDSATRFVTKEVIELLSGNKVYSEVFDHIEPMAHITLARWADLVVVVPATANIIAKISTGLADDMLTNLCVATTSKIILVPAMNQAMWSNKILQENIVKLKQHNIDILGPVQGTQVCGESGFGNMIDLDSIVSYISSL